MSREKDDSETVVRLDLHKKATEYLEDIEDQDTLNRTSEMQKNSKDLIKIVNNSENYRIGLEEAYKYYSENFKADDFKCYTLIHFLELFYEGTATVASYNHENHQDNFDAILEIIKTCEVDCYTLKDLYGGS